MEQSLIERCRFETDVINKQCLIHGAEFTTVTQAEMNGELLTTYEWSLWKFKWKLEMILPKDYPKNPPLLRMFDESGSEIQHPDIDENGFFNPEKMTNFEWKPENTLYWLCSMVMSHLRETTIDEYPRPVLRYPRGDFRHEVKISHDEFHFLVSAFGCEYMNLLEGRHQVKFNPMGGKVRARNNDYGLVIKSDVDGIFAPIEAEIRDSLAKVRRGPGRQLSPPRNRRSDHNNNGVGRSQRSAAEEKPALEAVRGLPSSCGATAKPTVERGIGRGRGRPLPSNRSTSAAPTMAELAAGNGPGAVAAASSSSCLSGDNDDELDNLKNEAIQLLAQRICRACEKNPLEILLVDCGHVFCGACAGIICMCGHCWRCQHPIVSNPLKVYL